MTKTMIETDEGRAIMEVVGMNDPSSPFVTITQTCACGIIVTEHRYDMRDYNDPEVVFADGEADAEAMREHWKLHR